MTTLVYLAILIAWVGLVGLWRPSWTAKIGIATKRRAGVVAAAGFLGFMALGGSLAPELSPEEQAQVEAERAARAEDRAFDDRLRLIERCGSLLDGPFPALVDEVKTVLYDPDSFQHRRSTYWPVVSTPGWERQVRVTMDYGAANLYGAQVPHRAVGIVYLDGCFVVVIESNLPLL